MNGTFLLGRIISLALLTALLAQQEQRPAKTPASR